MAHKNEKKKEFIKCAVSDEKEKEEEEGNEPNIRTVKTQLKAILLPEHRDTLITALSKKSIIATEICCLASLLLMYRV